MNIMGASAPFFCINPKKHFTKSEKKGIIYLYTYSQSIGGFKYCEFIIFNG